MRPRAKLVVIPVGVSTGIQRKTRAKITNLLSRGIEINGRSHSF
jgi:hypothetical protein